MNSYDSYKDSGVEWIGEIPSHWDRTKVKYFGKISSGDSLDSKLIDKEEGDYPVYGGNGVMGYHSNYNIDKEVLIIGRVGEKCGNVHYSDKKVYVNDNSLLFEPYNKEMSLEYLFHNLTQRDLNQLRNKNTQPLITGTIVKDEFVPSPPLKEQQQIVSFLDDKTQKIDSLIQQKEKKIELLKEKRTSLINHVVTKGLESNVEMKDSGVEWIGEIPNHWKRTPLKYNSYMKGRIGWKGLKQDEFLDKGDYYLITGHDIKNDKMNWENCYHISKERYEESPEIMLHEGDLLFTKDGTIGKTLYIESLPKPTSLNSHLLVIRPLNRFYSSKFLQYMFKTTQFLMYVEHNKTGTTFYGMSQNSMENFKGYFPPLSEQQQIVEYLDKQTEEIDTLIQLEQKKIDTLKEYRKSLISEVVTGKIRVCEEDNSLSLNSQIV